MSFPMFRPAFMPGPSSNENKLSSLLAQPLSLPTRPLLPPSQIMPDNAVPRFMGQNAPPMLVLPSNNMVSNQPQPPQNMLAFNPSNLNANVSAGSTNNLGSALSSLSTEVQNYLNQVRANYHGMTLGVPPPRASNIPVCSSNPAADMHALQQPRPPPLLAPPGKPLSQLAPVQMMHDMQDQEADPEQPLVDPQRTSLDFFNSDLHLEISKSGYEAKNITDPPGFCFCWAGVRATHGVSSGKVLYEVRIVENLKVDFGDDHTETNPHLLRIGWSVNHSSLQLGEEMDSWGYGGTGRFSTNNKFAPYGETYGVGDVVAALLDLDSRPPTISFAKNGRWLGVASPLWGFKAGCPERALFPHILSKNCRFEVNFGQQGPWCSQHLIMGHTFIDYLLTRVRGSVAPKRKADCEMIMIVGLPGAGKTSWGLKMFRENPDKCYNIIGTDTLIDKMKVMGLPRRNNYHGRWEVLIQKATSCLNKLFIIAGKRRRNYILDQTNVYASARKRKMKYFTGFKRICAVVQPDDDELKRREWKRTFEDGKLVPEDAVLEMKFNYSLPEARDEYVDDVIWIELSQQDSNEVVRQYGDEARSKLPSRKRPVGPDSDQSSDNKHLRMWENQSHLESSSADLRSDMRGEAQNPGSDSNYNFSLDQQQYPGFNNMMGYPQQDQMGQSQDFQSLPPTGVPTPSMPGPSLLTMPQDSYEGWDGRLRMPGSQGLLQTPSSVNLNQSNSFSVPDLSQPPPLFPPMQADFNQPPPNLMSQQEQHWTPDQQNFSDNMPGILCPGDVDIRSENHPRDSDRRAGRDDDRYDYQNPMPRDEQYDRERESRFSERREEWRPDRNSRREPFDGHRGRGRDDNGWFRRDDRPVRRSPDRGPYMPRGRGRHEDHRGSRDSGRDSRRWNDGRQDRSRSKERGAFQERPTNRNRWEDGNDDRPHSGQNRPQRSLLGDSPQPLIPVEMMDKWKDVSRPPRPEGGSNFEPLNQPQRPPANPRFAGPRASQAPPPLRGPRPMPPRVPPPSLGFRGTAQKWP